MNSLVGKKTKTSLQLLLLLAACRSDLELGLTVLTYLQTLTSYSLSGSKTEKRDTDQRRNLLPLKLKLYL